MLAEAFVSVSALVNSASESPEAGSTMEFEQELTQFLPHSVGAESAASLPKPFRFGALRLRLEYRGGKVAAQRAWQASD